MLPEFAWMHSMKTAKFQVYLKNFQVNICHTPPPQFKGLCDVPEHGCVCGGLVAENLLLNKVLDFKLYSVYNLLLC